MAERTGHQAAEGGALLEARFIDLSDSLTEIRRKIEELATATEELTALV